MNLTEKDIEDMIWEAAKSKEGRKFLNSRGLCIMGTLFRQVGIGNYGIADLVSITLFGRCRIDGQMVHDCQIDVYELKRDAITLSALGQAVRYIDGIQHFLNQSGIRLNINYKVHLIGNGLNQDNDFTPIALMMGMVNLYKYSVNYDGISFIHLTPDEIDFGDPGKPAHRIFSKQTLRAILQEKFIYGYSKPA